MARAGAFELGSRERTIFAVIISRNSEKSIVPEPSLSMSEIIFLISPLRRRGEGEGKGRVVCQRSGCGCWRPRRAKRGARGSLLGLEAERAHRDLKLLRVNGACTGADAVRCRGAAQRCGLSVLQHNNA